MPMLARLALSCFLLIGLAGCSAPVLDADSDAAWVASVQRVRAAIDTDTRDHFDAALVLLAPEGGDPGAASSTANRKLHGLGAEAVLALGAERQAAVDAAERAALAARRDEVAADREAVSGLRVDDVREYRKDGRRYLALALVNDGTLDVVRFAVLLTLASPGRDEPWLRQEFTVPVGGTLEPGARHETTMTPAPGSPWDATNATPDAEMSVEIVSVTTPSGERYLASGAYDGFDARRLAELEAKGH